MKRIEWAREALWHLVRAVFCVEQLPGMEEFRPYKQIGRQGRKERMSPLLLLITTLIGGASSLLEASKNKSLANAGVDIELADGIAMSILQATAQVKGASVDWTNPTAVAAYVQSLPGFTPIPDPSAAPTPTPPATS